MTPSPTPPPVSPVEEVELVGHLIDSLILPKVLDDVVAHGGTFEILEMQVGHGRQDTSRARLAVRAGDQAALDAILDVLARHGAVATQPRDCVLEPADMDGAFPEGFYCTTNLPTEVRLDGRWIPVDDQEMDCGVVVAADGQRARCVPMNEARRGDRVVIGRAGTRVHPTERARMRDVFSFMNSAVSSEKPKGVTVREIARAMRAARDGEGRILLVGGPAIIHTGSRAHVEHLVREGYVSVLFAGNALAAHDIEESFFGTSLGVSMAHGGPIDEGHEHHLRSINRIRRLGGIVPAVERGVLTSGILFECVRAGVPFLLAGSIRDDGPLPDVETDVVRAQQRMRVLAKDVTFCLMIATTLHSIAVGNILPARVKVVCVDINPATVTKLCDRGTFQTVGLVTDVEPFLRVLVDALGG